MANSPHVVPCMNGVLICMCANVYVNVYVYVYTYIYMCVCPVTVPTRADGPGFESPSCGDARGEGLGGIGALAFAVQLQGRVLPGDGDGFSCAEGPSRHTTVVSLLSLKCVYFS